MEATSIEEGCQRANSPEAWQQIITALWQTTDFANQPFFFTLTNIFARNSEQPERPVEGEYLFQAGKNY
ncbi:hypothetical protein, partial [Klebsiella pneumoniae]|uniref:hypothetical protein n=1 Tax=Klebsiella pneumoniae TaxID=573 RepID=UPI0025A0F7B5